MDLLQIIFLALTAIIVGLALWQVPKWQVRHVDELKTRLELENATRKTLAQIVAGAAFLGGLYFAAETLWVSQEGQITDRYIRAIEQLGHKEYLAVRLGGIYALERIAKDSKSAHWTIMEVLTAYLRERAPWKEDQSLKEDQPQPKLAPDIQAVLTVLGRRSRTYQEGEVQRLHLVGVNIRRAILRGARLEGAVLSEARLEGAFLAGAHLAGAVLREAHLEGADLLRANLEEAYLVNAHLERANLTEARMEGAILKGAHLEGAILTDAVGLTLDQIESAVTDEKTRFPTYFRPPAQTNSKAKACDQCRLFSRRSGGAVD